jgi:hypothetical protein
MEVNYHTSIEFDSFTKSKLTKFPVSCFYGFDWLIREYSKYPSYLPLTVGIEHGPSVRDEPTSNDLNAGFPLMYMHSLRLVNKWREMSKIPCKPMMSPFAYYRRSRGIKQDENASGTLAFPLHSTQQIDSSFDIDQYIQQLDQLPQAFQPVGVCMYYADITKGMHKPFLDKGFKVYTAGHRLDPEFPVRFYEMLKKHKYTISNHIGSYTYYSVEMGIPFSLHGVKGMMYNHKNKSHTQGYYDPEIFEPIRVAKKLFEGLNTAISTEQLKLVTDELGLNTGISSAEMRRLNFYALYKYYFNKVKKKIIR